MKQEKTTQQQAEQELTALISRAVGGDQLAYEQLYTQYAPIVYRLSYGVLLDQQDAEEVLQDSLEYAFRNLHRFDPNLSAFKTWLYTITMSRCRNKRRRKWLPTVNLADVMEFLPGKEAAPEAQTVRRGESEAIWAAMQRLSPKLREAVVLRYFDGLTYREMAEVMGCPQKTAESRVRLAHEALHEQLTHLTMFGEDNRWGYDALPR